MNITGYKKAKRKINKLLKQNIEEILVEKEKRFPDMEKVKKKNIVIKKLEEAKLDCTKKIKELKQKLDKKRKGKSRRTFTHSVRLGRRKLFAKKSKGISNG